MPHIVKYFSNCPSTTLKHLSGPMLASSHSSTAALLTAGLQELQHGGLLQQQMQGGGHRGAQAGVPDPQQVTTLQCHTES